MDGVSRHTRTRRPRVSENHECRQTWRIPWFACPTGDSSYVRASDAFSLSVLRCIIVTFGAADGEVLTESSISFHFNRVAHGGGVRSLCLCGFVKRGVRCGVDGGDDDIFDTE